MRSSPVSGALHSLSKPEPHSSGEGRVLEHLRSASGTCLHVIDPYKTRLGEAIEKARALEDLGFPLLILGSTDYCDFEQHVPRFVEALKDAVAIPVVLHFPPRPGRGFPVADEADAVLFTAVLNSSRTYFVWRSYLETLTALARRHPAPLRLPEFLFTAGMTFRPDPVSGAAVGAVPSDETPAALETYASVITTVGFDLVYLYSRHEHVPVELCESLRRRVGPDPLMVASGGVRSRDQIDAYLRAGVSFVAFGGALETPDWRTVLRQLAGRRDR